MNSLEKLLTILFEKQLLTSKEIADYVFNGNMDSTYKLVSEAQKRQLVTSRRKGKGGGRSPKIYKITRKGMRIIKQDTDKTPEFPSQSDYMRRKLIIAEIKNLYEKQSKEVFTGEEAIRRLAEHISQIEKCEMYIAYRILPLTFKDILAFEKKAIIYYVPHPQEGSQSLKKRLDAYKELEKYADLIIMPITELQQIIYSRVPNLKQRAKIYQPIL
jgi:DNA-binding PadR family transcriptional regulator